MKRDRLYSYTAADTVPVKLIQNQVVVDSMEMVKIIPPIHPQFIPTNKCNLKCKFCSCSGEDRKIEMGLELAKETVNVLDNLGMHAVTITGGGEPLCHPDIGKIIDLFSELGVEVGLVTNGTLLDSTDYIKFLTWCRISHGSSRPFDQKYQNMLSKVINRYTHVGWAFSYVATYDGQIDDIINVVKFANDKEFTHVRIVSNILDPNAELIDDIKEKLSDNVDDSLVIYQARDKPKRGSDCYICYLKPVIAADGGVYTCCGAQYALKEPSNSMPDELRLCHIRDLPEAIDNSNKPFDGSLCHKCYYTDYNRVLEAMFSTPEHSNFV